MRQIITSTVLGWRLATLLLFCYWLLIFTGTHLPRVSLPGFGWSDKVYHLVAFVGLSFLLCWAIPGKSAQPRRHVYIAAGIAVFYGAFDELTQLLVKGRNSELLDFVADSVGVLIGVCIYMLIRRQFATKSARKDITIEVESPQPLKAAG